jgi:hypothetical protein
VAPHSGQVGTGSVWRADGHVAAVAEREPTVGESSAAPRRNGSGLLPGDCCLGWEQVRDPVFPTALGTSGLLADQSATGLALGTDGPGARLSFPRFRARRWSLHVLPDVQFERL